MLLQMLKSLKRSAADRRESAPGAPRHTSETPLEAANRLERAHAAAPMAEHLEIAFGAMMIGERSVAEVVEQSLADSGATIAARKRLHRPLASYFLCRYFVHSLSIPGARAECGVLGGTSALIACRAARAHDPAFSGAGLHLIDSFEGLGEPTEEDRFGDGARTAKSLQKGAYAARLEIAQAALAGFSGVSFHKGWIPEVLGTLPESTWAFVHIDVDLYAPSYGALSYFHPRLSPGGVIICDDYGSPTFPGAHRAWHQYCDENALAYVVLDSGQAVILKR
jgi:O-methyltransferase